MARLVRFCMVGALATLVFYFLLWLMVDVLGIPVLVGTSVAFVLVCAENYVLHYGWTFASNEGHDRAIPKFIVTSVTGFGINYGVMYCGVEGAGWNYLFVQAFAIAAVIAWNFSLGMLWIFKSRAQ